MEEDTECEIPRISKSNVVNPLGTMTNIPFILQEMGDINYLTR